MIGPIADFTIRPRETGSSFSLFLIRTGEQPSDEIEGSAVNPHRIRGSPAAPIGRSTTKASMWDFWERLSVWS